MTKAYAISLFCLVFVAGVAGAQSTTSPQGGAAIYTGSAVCVGSSYKAADNTAPLPPPCTDATNNGQWFTVMNSSLKASTNKAFFISPSLVTGLYTNTQVKGNTATTSSETATAVGSVSVRVLLDCTNCAAVGAAQSLPAVAAMYGQPDPSGKGVVFDARIQQLTATLGRAINDACLVTGISTCPPETIALVLSTTSAHTFNFIMNQVGAGAHTVTVQARLDAGAICYGDNGTAGPCSSTQVVNTALASSISAALFGVGSVTVIPVQLAPGFIF